MPLTALVLPFAQPFPPLANTNLTGYFRYERQASRSPHWLPSLDAPPECPQSGTLWTASPYSGLPPPFRRWSEAARPRGETAACRTRNCRRREGRRRLPFAGAG